MNKKIEEEFVNTYIIKNKRERLLFELQNPKRREEIGMGMPSIAIFDDFVIIETEQEQGPAVKYLLEK